MRTILIALASALLLAFIVMQLNVLFFADDQLTAQHHLALLVLTVVALFINGLFNAHLALRDVPKTGRGRDRNRDRDRRSSRGRDGRDRDSARGNNARNGGEKNARSADKQRDKKPRGERRSPKGTGGNTSAKETNKETAKASNDRTSDSQEHKVDPAPQAAPADAERGSVKWFNRSKGYGFIMRESGEEIFVHQRNVVPQAEGQRGLLRDGQTVAFVVVKHDKGVQADRVTILES